MSVALPARSAVHRFLRFLERLCCRNGIVWNSQRKSTLLRGDSLNGAAQPLVWNFCAKFCGTLMDDSGRFLEFFVGVLLLPSLIMQIAVINQLAAVFVINQLPRPN